MNTRVQLEFSEVKIKEIEHLMKELGIVTRKDYFNNALTLFKWAIDERREGRSIASIDNQTNRYRELLMPALAGIGSRREGDNGGGVSVPPEDQVDKEVVTSEDKSEFQEASAAQASSW